LPLTVGVKVINNYPNSVNNRVVSPAGDFNGDGIDDLLLGNPLDPYHSSGAFLVLGGDPFSDLDLATFNSDNSRGIKIAGGGSHTGFSLSSAGDFNGDGYDDLLIGTWDNAAYIVYGKPSPLANIDLSIFDSPTSAGIKIAGGGDLVSAAGDFNSDGFDDVLVSAGIYDRPYDKRDVFYLILGHETSSSLIDLASFTASDSSGFQISVSNGNLNNTPSALGDFNGDGFDDILLGGFSASPFIVFGKANGMRDMQVVYAPTPGIYYINGANYGQSSQVFAVPSDFNGDGLKDALVANSATAFVIYGRSETSGTIDVSDFLTTNTGGFRIDGDPKEVIGNLVACAGDVNGDGFSDIMLSAPNAQHNAVSAPYGPSGSTYVVYGRPTNESANINLAGVMLPGPVGFRIDGSGKTIINPVISTAGDVNHDGLDDMVIEEVSGDESATNFIVFGDDVWKSAVDDWNLY